MKKVISIGIIIAMCLILTLSATVLATKPDEAGCAGSVKCSHWSDYYKTTFYNHVVFNAHEAMGDKDAKGMLKMDQTSDLNKDRAVWRFDPVKYVYVADNRASFAARCNDPALDHFGWWLVVTVEDNGEPGWLDDDDGPDLIGWWWYGDDEGAAEDAVIANEFPPSPYVYAVESGNVQVTSN